MIEELLKDVAAALRENTEALRENTEALRENIAGRSEAVKAANAALAKKGGKAAPEKAEEEDEEEEKPVRGRPPRSTSKPTEEKKAEPKGKAAPPKADPKAKGKGKPADTAIATEVSVADARKIGGDYLAVDDADERDERRANVKAALAHLGYAKTADIDDATDRCKYAEYVKRWTRGEEVDFEEVDEAVLEAIGGAGGDDEEEEEI